MAEIHPVIETLEHRWMRAWIGGDAKTLKALASRDFRLVIGGKPAVMLDYKSWIDAAGNRYRCKSYRFGDIYARDHGGFAIFATQLEMESSVDGVPSSGTMWLTDVWRKSRVRRRWRLVERVLSRPEQEAELSQAVRSLQLWR